MWILCGLVALFFLFCFLGIMPSVLWHCWLGSRKNIQPVKIEWWGAGVVICLELGAVLHIAQLMPLPLSVSCFCNIQIGFTFHSAPLGSPGQRAIKWVYVLRHYDLLTWLLTVVPSGPITPCELRILIVFTALCYASAVLAMGLCPCLSQAGVLLKRQNVGSHKQHHTIPQGL